MPNDLFQTVLRQLVSPFFSLLRTGYRHLTRALARLRAKVRRGRIALSLDVPPLESEYKKRGLHREPNHFILYRVVGNDLYPRHKQGQSRQNLQFILDYEPELKQCEKRFIVNRIVDQVEEAAIIELLEKHGRRYLHLPFNLNEYARLGGDLECFPNPSFFLSDDYAKLSIDQQARAKAHWRRLKNNYVMNNNGARNAALRDGRREAKWVLPWDGNCFVTASAWAQIHRGVVSRPYLKYFVVPMARLTDNRKLLVHGFWPRAVEEPQLIFRKDARELFDERIPYGRRPKIELFWRLGIPGPWDTWTDDPWDLKRPALAEEAKQFGYVGWVARLSSGIPGLDHHYYKAARSRMNSRLQAIIDILDHLDQQVLRQRPSLSGSAIHPSQ